MKKTILFLLISMLVLSSFAFAQGETVVSLGANLSDKQKASIFKVFGVEEKDVKVVTITNKEERDYLQGIAPESKIGTRAISSAYVEPLEAGQGIDVETYNINWVTKEMYASALITAGVKDAKVIAAAPFQVSGTAALTGITKAFEEASGKKLDEKAKETANEELVKTGELGDKIGKDKAAILIRDIKEKILDEKIKDPKQIQNIIIQVAGDLNINLTQQQISDLVSLMEKISKLNINVGDINNQLKNITGQLEKLREGQEQAQGIFQKILNAIESFINWFKGIFGAK